MGNVSGWEAPSAQADELFAELALARCPLQSEEFDLAIRRLLEAWLSSWNGRVCGVRYADDEERVLRVVATRDEVLRRELGRLGDVAPPSVRDAAMNAVLGAAARALRTEELPGWCRVLDEALMNPKWAAVTLGGGAQWWGALLVARPSGDPWTQEDLRRVEKCARQIASLVVLARSVAEEQRRAKELTASNEVGRLITEPLDLASVLSMGVKHLSKLAGGVNVFVMLVHEEAVVSAATSLATPMAAELRIPLERTSIATAAILERVSICINDVESDERVNRQLARSFGHRALLATPLFARGVAVGSVILGLTREGPGFTSLDVEYTEAVANQLAIAIANARLIDDLKRSYAELERAQGALVQRERLAALGGLAAVVAHEVRNPLAVMWNALVALRRNVQASPEVTTLLAILEEESTRLNRIVGDLLDYARPDHFEFKRAPVGEIVADAVVAVRAAMGETMPDTVLRVDAPAAALPVQVDRHQLKQAIVNLVSNAVQAAGPQGHVRVEVTRDEEEGGLRIDVADDGPGIAEDARSRVFEPFFSTKATGTGLGLTVVKRVVEGHGGSVRVESEGGTVFRVLLPLREAAPSSVPPSD